MHDKKDDASEWKIQTVKQNIRIQAVITLALIIMIVLVLYWLAPVRV